jgi:putative Ca2+/H+ antiporter (TMEM165/GDT1 family)
MKFLYCLLALQAATALDLTSIEELKLPHALNLAPRAVPADLPADVTVTDSNTRPIEDLSTQSTVTVTSTEPVKDSTEQEDEANDHGNNDAFFMAISMIVVSEIGDKTFLISALMAMRHSRLLVFTASFASLAIMTILSGIVGHTLPTLLSKRITQFLAAVLFLIFGYKLTREGLAMSKDLGVEEELAEVEEELSVSDMNSQMNDIETGKQPSYRGTASFKENVQQSIISVLNSLKTISAYVFSPLWVQVFVMIFLGEWGDRSQIATIAMAAGSNYWLVILGAVVGHGICTAGAVAGGKMLASRISMRTVTLGGAFAFFVFSILYFYDAIYNTED